MPVRAISDGPPTRAGAARKFTSKGLATRTRIIAAAAELVSVRGVARTGLEDVQRQAGVSVSQIYHYCVGGCPIGSIAAELADNDPHARQDLIDSFERWEAPIRAGLARMRDRGDLRADTDVLALALLIALQGGLLLTQTRRNTTPLRAGLGAVLAHIRTYATEETQSPDRSLRR